MPERTETEIYVRDLIASDILYRVLKSLGEKGIRRLDKTAKNIADLVKSEAELGNRIEVKIKEIQEEMKARTMNEGIKEFKKQYPFHGKVLKELIDEKREERNNYLIYRIKDDFKLGEEDYVRVIKDLGFNRREASAIYPHILSYSQKKNKADEHQERKILLKEKKKK